MVVTESDPEEDPEEYEDDETEDGMMLIVEEEEEEEKEHPALADSVVVIPTVEPDSLPEGTEPIMPPPSTDISTTGARITVRLQASISLPQSAVLMRTSAMSYSITIPSYLTITPSQGRRLARLLRIASTQALIDAVTVRPLPSPPLMPITLFYNLHTTTAGSRRDDIPVFSVAKHRKRLYLSTLGSRYEVGESSTARPTGGRGIDYGFVSTVDAEAR
ncbi:hypothetical protein Tco_1360808 [Tanacetum coccineum]